MAEGTEEQKTEPTHDEHQATSEGMPEPKADDPPVSGTEGD